MKKFSEWLEEKKLEEEFKISKNTDRELALRRAKASGPYRHFKKPKVVVTRPKS